MDLQGTQTHRRHGRGTGLRVSIFAKPERSKYNRVVRALPYPSPSKPRERVIRGKANVKAAKRARQKARR